MARTRALAAPEPAPDIEEPVGADFLTPSERDRLSDIDAVAERAGAYRESCAAYVDTLRGELEDAIEQVEEAVAAGEEPPDISPVRTALRDAQADLVIAGTGVGIARDRATAARRPIFAQARERFLAARAAAIADVAEMADRLIVANAIVHGLNNRGASFGVPAAPTMPWLADRVAYWRSNAMPRPAAAPPIALIRCRVLPVSVIDDEARQALAKKGRAAVLKTLPDSIRDRAARLPNWQALAHQGWHRGNMPDDIISVSPDQAVALAALGRVELLEEAA